MSVVSSVLLRRLRTVYVDQAGPRPGDPSTAEGLTALEAELLDRGFAPTAELRAALAWLGPAGLADAGRGLLSRLDAELGADRPHMPLFRSFPASVPDDTAALYVDRVLTLLLQWPNQPCVLCGTAGGVHAVAPCAHLVCGLCWDGAAYTGCPICHRRIDPEDPFLTPPVAAAQAAASGNAGNAGHEAEADDDKDDEEPSAAGPLRLLALGRDLPGDAVTALLTLLARRTPLSPGDRDDLKLLLAQAPASLDWLPADIPVRATKALLLGSLWLDRTRRTAVEEELDRRLTTATDVLRLLAVRSGGEADLLEPRRFLSVPRPLRRRLLSVLEKLDTTSLVEDLLRHPGLWKKAAEVLHPYERHARHPRVAMAFAVLRGTSLDTGNDPLGEALRRTAAEHPGWYGSTASVSSRTPGPAGSRPPWPTGSRTPRSRCSPGAPASWCGAWTICCGCTAPTPSTRAWPGRCAAPCPARAPVPCSRCSGGCGSAICRATGGCSSRAAGSRTRGRRTTSARPCRTRSPRRSAGSWRTRCCDGSAPRPGSTSPSWTRRSPGSPCRPRRARRPRPW